MISKVVFEIKNSIRSWSDQEISFSSKNMRNVSIIIKDIKCELAVDGNSEDDNLQYIILIWELLVWEDGYFYKPISYTVDGVEKTIDSLVTINCRTTDAKWVSSAILLCRNQRQIRGRFMKNIQEYQTFRQKRQINECLHVFLFLLSDFRIIF